MNPQDADRRAIDRRRQDRRDIGGRRREDSKAGSAASGAASEADAAAASLFDPGWMAAGDAPIDTRAQQRQVDRLVRAQDSALSRVLRTYAAARAVVGLGLVVVQATGVWFTSKSTESSALVCVLYAAQAIVLWLLPRLGGFEASALHQPVEPAALARRRQRQWLATIGVDLVAFSLLHGLESGSAINYGALLVLPVLMSGVLTSRLLALGTAAAVALMLLAVSWRVSAGSADASVQMLQSGLAGLGMFVIALMAGELAGRLAREEIAARDSRELARQQAQLNRLVIEEMADGVLVIDRQLNVRAANPAARALLVDQGLGPPAPFTLQQRPAWAALHGATSRALLQGHWSEAGEDVMLTFGQGHSRTLRLRVRFMRSRALERGSPRDAAEDGGHLSAAAVEPFAVLLLEDLRTLQARLRQDKLAAMGRVSAGIAHEIRNPLAAIAQANDLLLEDPLLPPQRRLAQMVADNVQRLKRLVDDVMDLAPGAAAPTQSIDAKAAVMEITADWARTAQVAVASDGRLRTEWPAGRVDVLFDPEHLRRVLVNLLDNAHRHATPEAKGKPGAIFTRLAVRDDTAVVLSVLSDGPAIAPEVERYLFEPFFSTRSRGSGLGLYICRELCERYGASVEYRPRPTAERLRNEFFVTLRRTPPAA